MERTGTLGDELYYVRQVSPVSHPKSMVPQIFFALWVTWDAWGLRCSCARFRERKSKVSGCSRGCFG